MFVVEYANFHPGCTLSNPAGKASMLGRVRVVERFGKSSQYCIEELPLDAVYRYTVATVKYNYILDPADRARALILQCKVISHGVRTALPTEFSPIDGTLGASFVGLGDTVSPGLMPEMLYSAAVQFEHSLNRHL